MSSWKFPRFIWARVRKSSRRCGFRNGLGGENWIIHVKSAVESGFRAAATNALLENGGSSLWKMEFSTP